MRKLTRGEFILKARCVHGWKYDYSKVVYVNNRAPVIIICPIHGEFTQTPSDHLGGHRCRDCGYKKVSFDRSDTLESFIKKAQAKHGNKYLYTETIYVDCYTPIKIICPIHGGFEQIPYVHLYGIGCLKCSGKYRRNEEEFIEEATFLHKGKYEYSKVKYNRAHDNVIIICPIHGEFEQTPSLHLQGQGCPKCKESKGEKKIAEWLDEHQIENKRQYKVIPQQLSLIGRNKFFVDFYLPKLNTIIEFHGEQHYKLNKLFHKSEKRFQDQLDRDKRLRDYCKENKIKLIEIPYTDMDEIPQILSKKIGRL